MNEGVLRMLLQQSGLLTRYGIPAKVMADCLKAVEAGYRDNDYHNRCCLLFTAAATNGASEFCSAINCSRAQQQERVYISPASYVRRYTGAASAG